MFWKAERFKKGRFNSHFWMIQGDGTCKARPKTKNLFLSSPFKTFQLSSISLNLRDGWWVIQHRTSEEQSERCIRCFVVDQTELKHGESSWRIEIRIQLLESIPNKSKLGLDLLLLPVESDLSVVFIMGYFCDPMTCPYSAWIKEFGSFVTREYLRFGLIECPCFEYVSIIKVL